MRLTRIGLATALALTSTLALAQSGAGSAGGDSTATGTTTGSSMGTTGSSLDIGAERSRFWSWTLKQEPRRQAGFSFDEMAALIV